jgi:hypothetical protein
MKKFFKIIFWSKIAFFKLQVKPSALKRVHPALQKMKFSNFFLYFVGHFYPPGSGYGSTSLLETATVNCYAISSEKELYVGTFFW